MLNTLDNLPDLLTVKQASALIGLTPATVRVWISQKKIPVIRLSRKTLRIRRSALLAKIEMVTVPRLRKTQKEQEA